MRIIVRATDSRHARAAQERLAAAGVDALAYAVAADVTAPAPGGEDIIIVAEPDPELAEVHLRAACAREWAPLCVLRAATLDAPPPEGLDRATQFDGALALDGPAALLAAQIAAATRAAIAAEERVRRRATARGLGIDAPPPPERKLLKALYIGAPSPMFLALEHVFARHGGLVCAAFSSFSGFDHLHDEYFDAVVLNGASDPITAVALCAGLRRNASLHHMPTLVVTQPGDLATAKAAIERGASATVSANAPSAPALGWLFEAIRRERQRAVAEHEIRTLRDLMGDPRTGLFRREAFDAHLNHLAFDHHSTGRPLCLVALRVLPAHGARMPRPGVWAKGFGEIASLASRLVRDTDCGASVDAQFIVLALSATTTAGAKRTAERVASVAECTAFASGEGGTGPVVFEHSIAELQPGESGAALMARALRAFETPSAASA